MNHPGRVEQALVPTKLRTVKQRVQSVGILVIATFLLNGIIIILSIMISIVNEVTITVRFNIDIITVICHLQRNHDHDSEFPG